MDLGEKVRHMRQLRQMSTTDLAKATGLSQSYISSLENKLKTSPSTTALHKLAQALRVAPSYFLDSDTVTPLDVLADVSGDLKQFMLDLDNMPYMKLSKKAKESGITPEMLEGLLDVMNKAMKKKRKK